jgi:hypothetical protein
MILLIILRIFVISIVFVILTTMIYKFIKENRDHKKRMCKIEQWSDFNNLLITWSEEILDNDTRDNFIKHCVNVLIYSAQELNMSDDWCVDKEKNIKDFIYEKWGKHIPSLLQEMREKKLNKILN